jgi:hypothetical protein
MTATGVLFGPLTRFGQRRAYMRQLVRMQHRQQQLAVERREVSGVEADRLGMEIAQLDETRSGLARDIAALYPDQSKHHDLYADLAELLHNRAEERGHLCALSMRTMAAIHAADDMAVLLADTDELAARALLAATPHEGGFRLGVTPSAVRLRLHRKDLVDKQSVLTWAGGLVRAHLVALARAGLAEAGETCDRVNTRAAGLDTARGED